MLSGTKLKQVSEDRGVTIEQLAAHLARGGMGRREAVGAIRNWMRRLYNPLPSREDVDRLASALGVEANAISEWRASHRFAPSSVRKAHALLHNATTSGSPRLTTMLYGGHCSRWPHRRLT